jgi:Uma2 family endonuclease
MTLKVIIQDEKVIKDSYIIMQHNVTEDEFWEFANEDIKCELLNGVLVIHSPASTEHEDIFTYLTTIFRYYLDYTRKGSIFGSRLVMRLSKEWNPEPDILIIQPDKYNKLSKSRLEGPADIIIEILSPSTKETDLNKKLPNYLKFGIKEVWIIDPEEESIKIHSPNKITEINESNSETMLESEVISGLKIKPKWLWNREKYPTYFVIEQLKSNEN